MPIDPRQLRPTELVRLLNSTPLGEVISERQLLRHRSRAGFRIGDGRRLDLFRYVAWLVAVRHEPKPEPDADPYESLKERARARNAALSQAGRDIGEIPAVVNPKRKARAKKNFRFFCEAYFSAAFPLPWSSDHLKVIAKIERAVLTGGLFAQAMPRGSGKTTLTTVACVWAILFGSCPFVCLIAASAERARSLLANIKTWFETNELLLEDFPEVIYPIRKLGRITNRQLGQMYKEEPTRIEWNADKIVMPTIPGSKASGAVMTTSGMKGSEIRGQNHPLVNGTIIRPSLAIIDDPQTTESAWSLTQCKQREAILSSDILGMAGPGQKIAAIMCCTVIHAGDMADNVLDRTKHPQWQGERTKMVYAFPTDEKLWARYAEIRAESFRNDGDGQESTEFYRKNRTEMDAGAVVAWPERYNNDELSAIQHAMNLKLRNKAAFFAEYQNEPFDEQAVNKKLTAEFVASKINGLGRGIVPKSCEYITAYVDVHARLLYYVVSGWSQTFTGSVIDYGSYPSQPLDYYSQTSAPVCMADVLRASTKAETNEDAWILAGLQTIIDKLLGLTFTREDGAELKIGMLLIDARWGEKNALVKQFCRRHPQANTRLMAAQGIGIGPAQKSFDEYNPEPGTRQGMGWRIAPPKAGDRWVTIDTNLVKSFTAGRLALPLGTSGGIDLFGLDSTEHAMLADHCVSEAPVETTAKGRTRDVWEWLLPHQDNHLWDCLNGSVVGASMLGCAPPELGTKRQRRRLTLAEMAAAARR